MSKEEDVASMVIYAYIDSADMDCDGIGHITIRKHRKTTMERTLAELRKHKGKSVAIFISENKGER